MPTNRYRGRTATVLLVDDNAGVRAGVRVLLSGDPTLRVVGEAENGADALDRARELRPDLVVLDQEMPGLTGTEVLRELRRLLPGTRVTMFTMSLQVERQAQALGAAAVVSKEDPRLLLTTLRRLAGESDPLAIDGLDARDVGSLGRKRLGH